MWYIYSTSPRFFCGLFLRPKFSVKKEWASLQKKPQLKSEEGGYFPAAQGLSEPLPVNKNSDIRRCHKMRVKITMACTECKQRNYDTVKNKKNDPDRLEMNKYCRFCRKHTLHRETK